MVNRPVVADEFPIYTTPDPLKSGLDHFLLTVYTGNNQVRLMIERVIVHMRETTVKHGRLI